MARYRADQIYAFAREAGFSPDQAATMTAIALAESGGRSESHNAKNEDSRGLWQINVDAHGEKFGNLYDPVQNAKAAFAVSQGGADISPWTTTHGGMGARYLRFRADAEAAAAAYGDGTGRGMWEGTSGYGDHTAAGDPRGGGQPSASTSGSGSDNVNVQAPGASASARVDQPGEEYGIALDAEIAAQGMGNTGTPVPSGEDYGIALDSAVPVTPAQPGTPATPAATDTAAPQAMTQTAQTPAGGDPTKLQTFLDVAVAQTGDEYVFGAPPADPNDPNPSTFDCSELVKWAAGRAGVNVPDGSWIQYQTLAKGGNVIPVEQAINTPGALLFSFSSDPMASSGRPKSAHVAISLGNGKTIEAKGTEYGVGSWEANTKRFQYAAVIPELSGAQGATPMPQADAPATPTDTFGYRVSSDPVDMDNSPATLAASHQLTGAAPPPTGTLPEPPPPPDPVVIGDVDQDGMDDALQHATDFTDQPDSGSEYGLSDVDDFSDSTTTH